MVVIEHEKYQGFQIFQIKKQNALGNRNLL